MQRWLTMALVAALAGCGPTENQSAPDVNADFSTDDVAYLTQLGLIRGHLAVGYALYTADLPMLAETHMKHPRAEIYTVLETAFERRGCAGFAAGLSGLTEAVVNRAGRAEVTSANTALLEQIARCELSGTTVSADIAARVIRNLLQEAAFEYGVGLVDGEIVELHEYQDAWGFTRVAGEWAAHPAFESDPAVGAQIREVLNDLEALWPSLQPSGPVSGKAAALYGAAARVEIAALALAGEAR